MLSRFSDTFYEMRIRLSSHDNPPYDIHALLLSRRATLTEHEIENCQLVEKQVRNLLDATKINLGDFAPTSETEISVFEYFVTVPVFLENLTYYGDEVIGDEPYGEAL